MFFIWRKGRRKEKIFKIRENSAGRYVAIKNERAARKEETKRVLWTPRKFIPTRSVGNNTAFQILYTLVFLLFQQTCVRIGGKILKSVIFRVRYSRMVKFFYLFFPAFTSKILLARKEGEHTKIQQAYDAISRHYKLKIWR